ncbi:MULTISPECIES: MFS transporter [unclassified Arthrobacter]|uniref:MFS transporter n=1 Tax=unclassified Arthrobacter TaxID=235627 RepID=UPI001C84E90B|nr:MFS transporter [Arthrobacter sp. MAHUQ-56]MBX7444378.1 MHS family MFS transporter [Arthrobacter sp. MAHUQ-56]
MTERTFTRSPELRSSSRERRRVVFATVAGTTIEWYDFFLYATAAGLIFTKVYFEPAGSAAAPLLAFLTVGISFLFRPLGAFLAGHFGDRYGRRVVLMATLVLMGASTALIGLLPTYDSIGLVAPILLVVLRILQGISAGGEWGGAALLAVEHAPTRRRGIFGASPQIGTPLGLLLASGMLATMTMMAPGDAFLEWGWRVPFILSVALIVIGYYIRRRVDESPVFSELAERKKEARAPIVELFRKHWRLVLLAALIPSASQAAGYMTTGGYIQRYATDPAGPVGLNAGEVLWVVTASAVSWLIFTLVGGWLSDKFGRQKTMLLGWLLLSAALLGLFPLVNTASIAGLFAGLTLVTVGLGMVIGPLSAHYTEIFPATVRFSGVSIAYALGAIVGGAFAPTIAQALVQATGSTGAVTVYLEVMVVVSIVATLLVRDRTGVPLGAEAAERVESPIHGVNA